MVELDPACKTTLRQESCLRDDKLVKLWIVSTSSYRGCCCLPPWQQVALRMSRFHIDCFCTTESLLEIYKLTGVTVLYLVHALVPLCYRDKISEG